MDEIKELLETRQYTSLRQKIAEMNEADVAVILEELETEDMLKVFRILPKDLAADVFSYMEVENQQMIITPPDQLIGKLLMFLIITVINSRRIDNNDPVFSQRTNKMCSNCNLVRQIFFIIIKQFFFFGY